MRNYDELNTVASQINIDLIVQGTPNEEIGTREFLSHIIKEYDVTFEFARDVLYRLLSDEKIELTNRYRVKKKTATA